MGSDNATLSDSAMEEINLTKALHFLQYKNAAISDGDSKGGLQ